MSKEKRKKKLGIPALITTLALHSVTLESVNEFSDDSFWDAIPPNLHTHTESFLTEPVHYPVNIMISGSTIPTQVMDEYDVEYIGQSSSEGFVYIQGHRTETPEDNS